MKYRRKETIKAEQLVGDPDSVDKICKLIGDDHIIKTTEYGLVVDSQLVNINDFVIYDQHHNVKIFSDEAFNAMFEIAPTQ